MTQNRLVSVRSRNIEYVSYDEKSGDLCVEFRTGLVHKYRGVPRRIYVGLLSAANADDYFARYVQFQYRVTQLHYYL